MMDIYTVLYSTNPLQQSDLRAKQDLGWPINKTHCGNYIRKKCMLIGGLDHSDLCFLGILYGNYLKHNSWYQQITGIRFLRVDVLEIFNTPANTTKLQKLCCVCHMMIMNGLFECLVMEFKPILNTWHPRLFKYTVFFSCIILRPVLHIPLKVWLADMRPPQVWCGESTQCFGHSVEALCVRMERRRAHGWLSGRRAGRSFVSAAAGPLRQPMRAVSINADSHTQADVRPCMSPIRLATKCKTPHKPRHYVHTQPTVNDEADLLLISPSSQRLAPWIKAISSPAVTSHWQSPAPDVGWQGFV